MPTADPHSYYSPSQPRVRSLEWKARVDFPSQTLRAEAQLRFGAASAGALDLDTRDLLIDEVTDAGGAPLNHALHASEPILGARLRIELPRPVDAVRIRYRTVPKASALQWLSPQQTQGGHSPFLFSQCQAIHARSVVPLQDTPLARITYRAELEVPRALTSVMAAASRGRSLHGDWARDAFEMPQPIPPYLFAFAVGELASCELSPRSRVWAEPPMLAKAAAEFSGVEAMILAAEGLFGPYEWDRFDILTMPPSFPYGGMENPRLTFVTPTIIAGDKSLVNVLAHELAHSWTGNLVTNANAEHFWLNEGFTVYAERRLLEVLEGEEVCALHAALGLKALKDAVTRFEKTPQLSRLRTHLDGVDPDEAYSQVPYEKGYLFVRALEEAVGRPAFDDFLRRYLSTYRFRSLTTEEFEAFARRELPSAFDTVDARVWFDEPGIPASAPTARSARLEALARLGAQIPTAQQANGWTATEWQLYLESLPRPLPLDQCEALDSRYRLTGAANYEVLVSWLQVAVSSNHAPALRRAESLLGSVGRMKYLRPLYEALAKNVQTRELANTLFQRFKLSYHPIAQQVVERVLA